MRHSGRTLQPKNLREGKAFHTTLQAEWKRSAQGVVATEKGITKPSGRKGRVDVHVDAGGGLVAVVELKDSDWDRMTEVSARRNAARQISQIWDYIEARLAEGKEVSPGVVFPRRPRSVDRRNLIESLFEARGIAVVWQDETLEECSDRARRSRTSTR